MRRYPLAPGARRDRQSRPTYTTDWHRLSIVIGLAAVLGLAALYGYVQQRTRILYVYSSQETDGRAALDYVNEIRQRFGRSPLAYDRRAFSLAMMRAWDMRKYRYYDHTNPFNGSCPYTMKTEYGFQPHEFVAENLNGYPDYTEDFFTLTEKRPIREAVDAWMGSRGHRFNLLYEHHTAGAIACYKDKCVFLGVNQRGFGEGCVTAAEGLHHWQTIPLQPGEL